VALNQTTAEFVAGVSKGSGIDPRVLLAWIDAEGAYAPNGTGGFNFLNLKPAPGGRSYSGVPIAVSSGGFEQFQSITDAITETVNRLSQSFASGIVGAAKTRPTPAAQISAIAASGWDQTDYGGPGGPTLAAIFAKFFGGTAGLSSPYEGPTQAPTILSDFAGNIPSPPGGGATTLQKIAAFLPGVPGADTLGSSQTTGAGGLPTVSNSGGLIDWTPLLNKAAVGGLYLFLSIVALALGALAVRRASGAAPGPAGYARGKLGKAGLAAAA